MGIKSSLRGLDPYKSASDADLSSAAKSVGNPNVASDATLRYQAEKKKHGQRGPEKMPHSEASFRTSENLAEELGVSKNTIERDAQYASAVDALAKRYQAQKKPEGRPAGKLAHNGLVTSTAEKLSTEFGVSKNTIKRDAQYASAVDALAKNVGGDTKRDLLSGALKVAKQLQIAHDELANHGDGTFGKWCSERCGMSQRSAGRNVVFLSVSVVSVS